MSDENGEGRAVKNRRDMVAQLEEMRDDGCDLDVVEDAALRWIHEQHDPRERSEFVREAAWVFAAPDSPASDGRARASSAKEPSQREVSRLEDAAASGLRAIGFAVRWDGEFWLIRDGRGEPAMSGRGTREDLLAIAEEEGVL